MAEAAGSGGVQRVRGNVAGLTSIIDQVCFLAFCSAADEMNVLPEQVNPSPVYPALQVQ